MRTICKSPARSLCEKILTVFVARLTGSIMINVAVAVAIALFDVAIQMQAWLERHQAFGSRSALAQSPFDMSPIFKPNENERTPILHEIT